MIFLNKKSMIKAGLNTNYYENSMTDKQLCKVKMKFM
jgi:hypothetical protein